MHGYSSGPHFSSAIVGRWLAAVEVVAVTDQCEVIA
jgi:hypothetical protein